MTNTESKLWEIFSVAGLLVGPLTVAANWQDLPEQVPIHFGLFGQVDHWAAKEYVLILTFLSFVTYALFSYAQTHPKRSNVPWKVDDSNREQSYALVYQLLTWEKLVVLVLLSYLQWAIVNIALQHFDGLGVWFGPITLAAVVGPIVYFHVLGNKLKPVEQ